MAKTEYFVVILVTGMCISGSLNTIFSKLQVVTKAKGVNGLVHEFQHPWMQTLNMFMGECVCLIYYYANEYYQNSKKKRGLLAGHDEEMSHPSGERKVQHEFRPILVLIPALCDLAGTTLSSIGLLYLPASIWQMLRGSIILFTGLLSRVFLKRVLHGFHYTGMSIVAAGLCLVGVSAYFGADDSTTSTTDMLFGMVLVLAGMFANGIQFVVEETMLQDKDYPPLQVVGWEGIWGTLMTGLIALPVTYYIKVTPDNKEHIGGHYENCVDAFYMMVDNPVIIAYSICLLLTISSYNFFGLSVSKHVSSLARAVLDSLRTIVIWVVFIIVYYITYDSNVGEKWTAWSWIEVGGFFFLVGGTFVYSGSIRLPGFVYPDANAKPSTETRPEEADAINDGSE